MKIPEGLLRDGRCLNIGVAYGGGAEGARPQLDELNALPLYPSEQLLWDFARPVGPQITNKQRIRRM